MTDPQSPHTDDWAGARGDKWLRDLDLMEAMLAPVGADLLATAAPRPPPQLSGDERMAPNGRARHGQRGGKEVMPRYVPLPHYTTPAIFSVFESILSQGRMASSGSARRRCRM